MGRIFSGFNMASNSCLLKYGEQDPLAWTQPLRPFPLPRWNIRLVAGYRALGNDAIKTDAACA